MSIPTDQSVDYIIFKPHNSSNLPMTTEEVKKASRCETHLTKIQKDKVKWESLRKSTVTVVRRKEIEGFLFSSILSSYLTLFRQVSPSVYQYCISYDC